MTSDRANARNAVIAGFLGWTLDAFDFFVLVMVLDRVAESFHRTRPEIALTLTASLAMRPVGALLFGMLADRYGRRVPLMADIIFYSIVEVASGLAPNYTTFLVLRLLYGVGMGGEWGVGASLTMESVPAKWRGFVSGLLQEGYACGYLLAAAAYYVVTPYFHRVAPQWEWRSLFFLGGLPALLSLFIRAKVKETEAWKESRSDWPTYRREIARHWKLFLYLVLLMACMNSISHGTQDMYPTFMKAAPPTGLGFTPGTAAMVTMISMIGAILGGLAMGRLSDRAGRKRAIVTSVLIAVALIPLWISVRSLPLIILGAFLMQFMIQGAWGVIPAHINELSPDRIRGFFPGFAYQLGVLLASGIGYLEATFGEHFTYSYAMGAAMVIMLTVTAIVCGLGPERRGVRFGAGTTAVGQPAADASLR